MQVRNRTGMRFVRFCISGVHRRQTMRNASCSDGILNGDEGCIDGGRACPDQCLVNLQLSHDDCASLRCESAMACRLRRWYGKPRRHA